MITYLLAHGANPNLKETCSGETVFEKFLISMPEGCLAILDHFITLDGSSVQGKDLKIMLDFKLIHSFNAHEMNFLHKIVKSNRIEILKHPICESFLHMKWLRVRKYFYAYFMFYLTFLVILNGLLILDLSSVVGRYY